MSLADCAPDEAHHTPTGFSELDRVLGGGTVDGGIILLAGEPGCGKSSLSLQVMAIRSKRERCLYVSGEETAGQVADRSKRFGAKLSSKLFIYAESDLEAVIEEIKRVQPKLLVIDSAQTMRSSHVEGHVGGVTQMKHTAEVFKDFCKKYKIATIIIGHVNKGDEIAGPKTFEHLVDTVLLFEGQDNDYRVLRSSKNRFGSTQEVGIFEMGPKGMNGVANPSEVFMKERSRNRPGSVIAAVSEGVRTMLVEVQAKVRGTTGSGVRVANGIDSGRLAIILDLLQDTDPEGNIMNFYKCNCTVKIMGGIRVDDKALDLPIALAIASSARKIPVNNNLVAFGELDLTGGVRRATRPQARLKECATMGFSGAIAAPGSAEKKIDGFKVNQARNLIDAMEMGFAGMGQIPAMLSESKAKPGLKAAKLKPTSLLKPGTKRRKR
jgi:DNA repair protein RadA/Sms